MHVCMPPRTCGGVRFAQECFGYLILLHLHVNFETIFPFLCIMSLEF